MDGGYRALAAIHRRRSDPRAPALRPPVLSNRYHRGLLRWFLAYRRTNAGNACLAFARRTAGRPTDHAAAGTDTLRRSEERRVGKECRSRGSPDHKKKKEPG